MAYRRKPDTVDAWEYDPNGTPPTWLQTAINNSQAFTYSDRCDVLDINNDMRSAGVGDYVLRDTVTGGLSTATAAVFASRWEAVP